MSKFGVLRDIHRELKDSGEVQSIFSNEKKLLKSEDGKEIEVFESLENKQDIQDILEQNKTSVLSFLMAVDLPKVNKNKKQALKRFLRDYLIGLNIKEEGDLQAKLNYYLELYELYSLEQSEKINNEILEDKDYFSKSEILYELLYSSAFLPEYKNQKQFNEEMMKFLPRLEKTIDTFRQKRSQIIIPPVNSRKILGHLNDMQTHRVLGSKIIKGGLIKKIAYDFSLGERQSINEKNEFSFSFLINDENLLSREEFIVYLTEILKAKNIQDNKEFLFETDSFFNYIVYVGEEMFEFEEQTFENFKENGLNSSESGFLYNGFEIKIYARKKRNFETEEEFANICVNLPAITEKFIQDIYETYGKLDGEEEGFPEKPVVFDVSKNLNVAYLGEIGEYSEIYNSDDDGDGTRISRGMENKDKYKFYKAEDISYSLGDLVLEEKLLNEVVELLDFYKDIDFYIENNGVLPKGIVLYGPPGTGKTTITLILAKHSGAGVFVVDANIEDSYVGESANNVKKIADDAKSFVDRTGKPAIIFFDEADSVFSKRGGTKDFKEGMLSVLLQEMDGFDKKYEGKITFVFGTNRKDMLDNALLSRIDKHLEIPMPSQKAREKILNLHIFEKMKGLKETIKMYETADIDYEFLAKKLDGKSGRFIRNLVKNFHNKALREFKNNKNFVITNEFILDSVKYTEDKEENIQKTMGFKPQ